MESLYSISACGHPESSSSMHLPSYPCSWNTSAIPGRLDVFMTLDARFPVPFISGILLWNGGNVVDAKDPCLGNPKKALPIYKSRLKNEANHKCIIGINGRTIYKSLKI